MPHTDTSAPLEGITVLDATTSLGWYAGRLLADLGAEVVRLEGARTADAGPATDFRRIFLHAGKRILTVDWEDEYQRVAVERLLATTQILLTSEGPAALTARDLHPAEVTRRHRLLVHVSISPFGLTGPYADRPASDLTLLAAGGLLALAGDPDREPVRAWGEQSAVIAGAHATAAALIALHVLETEGVGQSVDLSAQEAVAHSLENAVQYLDLEGVVRTRAGAGPQEAGTGLFRCADGWIYVVGGLGGKPLAWDAIVEWLVDGDLPEAEVLGQDQWQRPEWRRTPQACTGFRDLFETFAAARTKQELFESGQRRGISVAPVATPADLMTDPQLAAREFFRTIRVDDTPVVVPGSPYRFGASDVRPRPTRTGGALTPADERTPACVPSSR
jgi:benzylsuccinate CoA-transferase BbsE subunit